MALLGDESQLEDALSQVPTYHEISSTYFSESEQEAEFSNDQELVQITKTSKLNLKDQAQFAFIQLLINNTPFSMDIAEEIYSFLP